ncbi:MAG: hypothetical protein ABSG59_18925 [Verrucomicrobiota bacterium]|jgi:Ca2+-binding EF-hand superfamily protein
MRRSSLITAALLAAAWTLTAQPSNSPPPARGHRPPPLPIVTALDTNGDGIIDANEIANAPAALKTLDKNGDGQLTIDEYMPPRPGGTNGSPPRGPDGRRPPVPLIVKALDVNGDGIIDASEIANASAALLKLDKNGDGKLTPDEYLGPPPGGQGGMGGPPPGDNGGPGGPPPDDDGGPGGPPPDDGGGGN